MCQSMAVTYQGKSCFSGTTQVMFYEYRSLFLLWLHSSAVVAAWVREPRHSPLEQKFATVALTIAGRKVHQPLFRFFFEARSYSVFKFLWCQLLPPPPLKPFAFCRAATSERSNLSSNLRKPLFLVQQLCFMTHDLSLPVNNVDLLF